MPGKLPGLDGLENAPRSTSSMILFNLLRRPAILCCLLATAGCVDPRDCPKISSYFMIDHWQGAAPGSVVVFVFKVAADASEQTKPVQVEYDARLTDSENDRLGKVLVLSPKKGDPTFLAADSYRIVIDGKTEYLIHHIAMSGRVNLGCPIESAEVNSCKIKPFRLIGFDSQCGRPLP